MRSICLWVGHGTSCVRFTDCLFEHGRLFTGVVVFALRNRQSKQLRTKFC